jgi:hypothetical protein
VSDIDIALMDSLEVLDPERPIREADITGCERNAAKGHVWTAPGWQEESSRRSIGRSSHVFGLLARFT